MKIQIFNQLAKSPSQKQLIEIFLDKILKIYYNIEEGINLIKINRVSEGRSGETAS